eukprot:scaffold2296_cov92-Cylindrotheca_fusiformis.AAC.3
MNFLRRIDLCSFGRFSKSKMRATCKHFDIPCDIRGRGPCERPTWGSCPIPTHPSIINSSMIALA